MFKKLRPKKMTNTNLKPDSYENKNIRSIYCRKGIKEKRERPVVTASRTNTGTIIYKDNTCCLLVLENMFSLHKKKK